MPLRTIPRASFSAAPLWAESSFPKERSGRKIYVLVGGKFFVFPNPKPFSFHESKREKSYHGARVSSLCAATRRRSSPLALFKRKYVSLNDFHLHRRSSLARWCAHSGWPDVGEGGGEEENLFHPRLNLFFSSHEGWGKSWEKIPWNLTFVVCAGVGVGVLVERDLGELSLEREK